MILSLSPSLFFITMKNIITLFFVLLAATSHAQITLEHTYNNSFDPGSRSIHLVTVDSGLCKYVVFNGKDSILIYNLDHSIDRKIIIPNIDTSASHTLHYLSKKLFDLNDQYEYIVAEASSVKKVRILSENGAILYSCDTCTIHNPFNPYIYSKDIEIESIITTEEGSKLLIDRWNTTNVDVYSLPGKLPGCSTTKASIEIPSIISSNSGFTTSAYPNPSNGKVRIEYKLPNGVSTGEIVIADALGNEVKRYRVGNVFSDILIEKSDLASGSYFYKLVTDKGESEAKKLVVIR